ncbi:MAG TPA: fumarylacetoacetase [Gemmatimonadaceae bacterium]|nr:fumarylacetoacetase [Gemmatimonadaceae bacterium]
MTVEDRARKSWVESANDPSTDFPIQNLPFGVFSKDGVAESARVGVAIGDQILDVTAALSHDLIGEEGRIAAHGCDSPRLNELMSLDRRTVSGLRRSIADLLDATTPTGAKAAKHPDRILVAQRSAVMHLPAEIGDYTDFYASIDHATNVGSMFRPDNPLLPNYKYVPIGYHGRASSIVASGSFVRRPEGQTRDDPSRPPTFGPTKRLDYELEVGAFIARGNPLGHPIAIGDAEDRIFGLCLVNDWSARDIQAWEYQPLGPFLAKSFATTVSPWVVTLDALEPFRIPAFARAADDPAPLPYLSSAANEQRGGIDITLEVLISSAKMSRHGHEPMRVSKGSFASMYWTLAQMVTHHASNGCNLRPADLIASGTVSGPTPESRGSLIERTWRGREPLTLPSGETRTFLEDGDEVIIRGWCERPGAVRIGFGECRGIIGEDVVDESFDEVGDDITDSVAEVAAATTTLEHDLRRLRKRQKKGRS